MAIAGWKQPVAVFAGKRGTTRWLVGDTAKAAEVLTKHWPNGAERGPAYYAACRACFAALSGRNGHEHARAAFIAAAEEADILAK